MSEGPSRIPLPLSVMLERIGIRGDPTPPSESVRHASPPRHLIQDFVPLRDSLEWRLSELAWKTQGILPFVDHGVPYVINNTGTLSVDAAALLFANCAETATRERIHVLELGAGTGLFARYFLDEFKALCARDSRDDYQRLTYWATDASARTVEQWSERQIFEPHAGHVVARACSANDAPAMIGEPIRAVFANYVLDVLPSAIVRKQGNGWEEVHARAWLPDQPELLRQYTSLSFEEIRLRTPAPCVELLPLLPLLDCETAFRPVNTTQLPELRDSDPEGPFVYNYAALACLQDLAPRLEPTGFVLVTDYSSDHADGRPIPPNTQRFGPTSAFGLNFPLMDARAAACGLDTVVPEGDDDLPIHVRLLSRDLPPDTDSVFLHRFSAEARTHARECIEEARSLAEAGSLTGALSSYRLALERNPKNWQLIGEVAEFIAMRLFDETTAIEMARAAVELNPWYSASLWDLLGHCLTRTGRPREAHECYLQAERITAHDPKTSLQLARSWLACGQPLNSLQAIARGLAHDVDATCRSQLLEAQQRALDSLTVRWSAEREAAARRRK